MSAILKTRGKSGKPAAVLLLAALVFFLLPGIAGAKDLQAGVSPIVLDLGTLEKGTSNSGSFFIVTSSQDEIVVKLDAQKATLDYFRKPEYSGIINSVSEEDSTKWVFFPSNPYVLRHTNETLQTAGGRISDWKKVSFVLNIPKNAETCNHAVQIKPTPYAVEEYGTSVNIIAVTALTVHFAVKGECRIGGRILDITQEETSGKSATLGAYFQNTGTATVSAQASSIAVYFENGTKIDESASGMTYVKPGEVKALSANFDPKKFIESGRYIVNATVLYGANSTSKQATIVIQAPKAASISEPSQPENAEGNGYIILLILAIIIAAAYKVYNYGEKS